jgi:hypothetical protein
MKTSLVRSLSALAATSLVLSSAALAGMPDAAGTLLGEKNHSTTEVVSVIVLAVVAISAVVYLRKRKSK